DEVLEIGPGSGFCSNYLRSWKVIVETLDMDEGKHPNIVANIIDYVPEKKYDHIIAFEVFEHIPYEQFLETLKRFKPYCKQIFLSIPVNKKALIKVHFELLSRWNINFQLDARRHRITEGHHFWEVDYKQYAVKKVLNDIKSRGYQLQNKAIDQYKLYLHLQS
ncbi:MAG: class I SAM-dependent methyltransferase, partial [Bacteroidales bacterium]|nr:class I SAM-dependent methyltransferase [Bacteroidales bacterium]